MKQVFRGFRKEMFPDFPGNLLVHDLLKSLLFLRLVEIEHLQTDTYQNLTDCHQPHKDFVYLTRDNSARYEGRAQNPCF